MINRILNKINISSFYILRNKIDLNPHLEKKEDKIEKPNKNVSILNEDGKYYYNKSLNDENYLFRQGIQIPQRDPSAKYFAIEKNGKIYHFFNAQNWSYGRMCVQISNLIRGKNKPNFNHCLENNGDICVVVNCDKIKLPGKKIKYKEFVYHTGFPGGLKKFTYEEMLLTKPELLVTSSVSKMMPRNKIRKNTLLKLKCYRGQEHDLGNSYPNFNYNIPYDVTKLIDLSINKDTQVLGTSKNINKDEMPDELKQLNFENLEIEEYDEITKIKENNKKVKINELKKLDKYNKKVYYKIKSLKHYIPKPKRKKIDLFENDDYRILKTEREERKFKVKEYIEKLDSQPDIEH